MKIFSARVGIFQDFRIPVAPSKMPRAWNLPRHRNGFGFGGQAESVAWAREQCELDAMSFCHSGRHNTE